MTSALWLEAFGIFIFNLAFTTGVLYLWFGYEDKKRK